MAKEMRRLGRGLNSLISSTALRGGKEDSGAEGSEKLLQVSIDRIEPNPFQPRMSPQRSDLRELVQSIRQVGILQPVTIRPKGDFFQLIAGERRWRAAREAGLEVIPALVREISDERMLEEALIENIQREDLNPIDRAEAYRRYCDDFDLSPEEVAERVAESRANVANYLRLLDLGDIARDKLATGALTMGHGRALLGISEPDLREKMAERADKGGWSVRALEAAVRKVRGVEPRRGVRGKAKWEEMDERASMLRDLEERFSQALGTAVFIKEGKTKATGRITIEYYSLEDFERIGGLFGVSFE